MFDSVIILYYALNEIVFISCIMYIGSMYTVF